MDAELEEDPLPEDPPDDDEDDPEDDPPPPLFPPPPLPPPPCRRPESCGTSSPLKRSAEMVPLSRIVFSISDWMTVAVRIVTVASGVLGSRGLAPSRP